MLDAVGPDVVEEVLDFVHEVRVDVVERDGGVGTAVQTLGSANVSWVASRS